ncbi:MAG: hypothetical protein V3V20_01235 [Algisphaera sp.]
MPTPPLHPDTGSHLRRDPLSVHTKRCAVTCKTTQQTALPKKVAPLDFHGPLPRLTPEAGHNASQLRLTGLDEQVHPHFNINTGQPIRGATDPRWILAVRAAESLDGSTLPSASRDRLIRLGKAMRLMPFDANLILAIVQDQARRGYAPAYCPIAGEPQLRRVPPAPNRPWPWRWLRRASVLFTALLLFEAAAFMGLF